jgi:hypothetical protein
MAEAVATLSLVINVFELLNFASRFANNFRSFYKSASEAGDRWLDMETINLDLQHVLNKLQTLPPGLSVSETGLGQLVQDCYKTALYLDEVLKPLAFTRSKNLGKYTALKMAFKSIWKEDKIQSLKKRLDQFRSQLNLHLQISL